MLFLSNTLSLVDASNIADPEGDDSTSAVLVMASINNSLHVALVNDHLLLLQTLFLTLQSHFQQTMGVYT